MIKDTHHLQGFNTPKLPKFKGHVKLTLHNCKNGKNEIIEADNLVTNAIYDIFASNWLGAVDYSKLMPIWSKWFSGILVSEQEHTLNANNYFPRSDSQNHIWGHAGTSGIDPEHDDDLTRGNPVSAAFVYGEKTLKQVWEWGTTRANVPDGRYIRSLALTHGDVGNAGLGSNTYAFQNFTPLEVISGAGLTYARGTIPSDDNVYARYDDSHGVCYYIGNSGEYTPSHKAFETNKVTIQIKKFPFNKVGLYDAYSIPSSVGGNSLFVTRTVTTSVTFYCNPAYYFDETNKRLWLFTNITSTSMAFSKTTINYTVIDLSDLSSVSEYAHGTIISDASDLAPLSIATSTIGIVNDGTYWYFPIGTIGSWEGSSFIDCSGYKKIAVSNTADQTTLSFLTSQTRYSSAMCGGGLLISAGSTSNDETIGGRVMNGAVGYSCKNSIDPWAGNYGSNSFYSSLVFSHPTKISSFVMPIGNHFNDSITIPRWIVANKMVNTTLFNLPTPVQKTGSQSMTVEYTLTEVDPNE